MEFVDQGTAVLVWQRPVYEGGRTDTTYYIRCAQCGGSVHYTPAQVRAARQRTDEIV